jgi:hypothetical protein
MSYIDSKVQAPLMLVLNLYNNSSVFCSYRPIQETFNKRFSFRHCWSVAPMSTSFFVVLLMLRNFEYFRFHPNVILIQTSLDQTIVASSFASTTSCRAKTSDAKACHSTLFSTLSLVRCIECEFCLSSTRSFCSRVFMCVEQESRGPWFGQLTQWLDIDFLEVFGEGWLTEKHCLKLLCKRQLFVCLYAFLTNQHRHSDHS